MQLTWDCDGDADGDAEGGAVADCVAGGVDCVPDEAVDGVVDGCVWVEVAECCGVVDELGDAEVVGELVDREVAEAFELAGALETLPVDVGLGGAPGLESVPGACDVDVDTGAAAPTGAAPSPVVGRLPSISRPMTMTPATAAVTVTRNPRTRRLRVRRSLWPFGKSAAEPPARTGPRSSGLFPLRSAGLGAVGEL